MARRQCADRAVGCHSPQAANALAALALVVVLPLVILVTIWNAFSSLLCLLFSCCHLNLHLQRAWNTARSSRLLPVLGGVAVAQVALFLVWRRSPEAPPTSSDGAFQSLWAWRAAASPPRSLILASALLAPRLSALAALYHAKVSEAAGLAGSAQLVAVLLSSAVASSPAAMAVTILKRTLFVALTPRCAVAAAALAHRKAAPFSAFLAVFSAVTHAMLDSLEALAALAALTEVQQAAIVEAFFRAVLPESWAPRTPRSAQPCPHLSTRLLQRTAWALLSLACYAALGALLPLLPPRCSDAVLIAGAFLAPAAHLKQRHRRAVAAAREATAAVLVCRRYCGRRSAT